MVGKSIRLLPYFRAETVEALPADVIPTGLAVACDLYILRNYLKLQDEVRILGGAARI